MMKKVLRIALYVMGGIVGLVVALFAFAVWGLSRGHDKFAATKNDLPSYVAGRWDWTSRARPCTDSAHTITFANDGRVMEIRQESDTGKGGASDPTVYDLLEVTPSRIRGAIRGETRKTNDGRPVVWDLVMFNVNEYHWHRTDWGSFGYTGAVLRCSPRQAGEGIAPPPA
jgi:hypothetical protein